MHMLLGKRDFLIKVNKPSTCHNHQKSWTPQRPFYCKWLNQEI